MNEERSRFEVDAEGGVAVLDFKRDADTIVLNHTEVPPESRGGGIASRLARHALDYAREQGLTVVPRCPFVTAYLRRHPEYRDLVQQS
jgi:uncharacterized protein